MAGAFALVVGIPSTFIALAIALIVISAGGPNFDVVIMNDVVLTGAATSTTVGMFFVAMTFGAVAIFSFVRLWKCFRQWRDVQADVIANP
jgi:dolichyl-phosphate-mannose--protein O-mannosyl transferase